MTAPTRTLDAPGMACLDLTPLIASTMRDLEAGEVLEVHADDPAARVGVPAWCRLTRNTLVYTSERAPNRSTSQITFHIAKKENRS